MGVERAPPPFTPCLFRGGACESTTTANAELNFSGHLISTGFLTRTSAAAHHADNTHTSLFTLDVFQPPSSRSVTQTGQFVSLKGALREPDTGAVEVVGYPGQPRKEVAVAEEAHKEENGKSTAKRKRRESAGDAAGEEARENGTKKKKKKEKTKTKKRSKDE